MHVPQAGNLHSAGNQITSPSQAPAQLSHARASGWQFTLRRKSNYVSQSSTSAALTCTCLRLAIYTPQEIKLRLPVKHQRSSHMHVPQAGNLHSAGNQITSPSQAPAQL